MAVAPRPEFSAAQQETYIRDADYGKIHLRLARASRWEQGHQVPLEVYDLFKHLFVFGASGAGKTFYVLNQFLEAIFRSTHVSPCDRRDERKCAMFICEPKGDFRDKIAVLSRRYNRVDDTFYFGPDHLDIRYDFFADRSELPMQRAGKLVQLMKAYKGGESSGDAAFWDTKATNLFINIFAMHSALERSSLQSEADPRTAPVESMSFRLLALLLMDRGHPLNKDEVDASRERQTDAARRYWSAIDNVVDALRSFQDTLGVLERRCLHLAAGRHAYDRDLLVQDLCNDPEALDRSELARFRIQAIHAVIDADPLGKSRLIGRLEALVNDLDVLRTTNDEFERGTYSNRTADDCDSLCQEIELRLPPGGLPELENAAGVMTQCRHAMREMLAHREKYVTMPLVEPRVGKLTQMLEAYEAMLVENNLDPRQDVVAEYFHGEYLNVSNDRMSGSVAAVASAVVNLFTIHPFDKIFGPGGTFCFRDVIDRGQIVYLDLPSKYQEASVVAALALKMDWFSAVLSRKRTYRDSSTSGSSELINQERPILHFSDEYATVASTGEYTGESSFLDKCREFRCMCILGAQNFHVLARRLSEKEILSILANCATQIFLRNTCKRTNELASEAGLTTYRANATLSTDAGEWLFADRRRAGRGFTTNYARTARYQPDFFRSLQDGEALLCLPPRFGKNAVQRVQFLGHPIE